jgi:hypothetical protein
LGVTASATTSTVGSGTPVSVTTTIGSPPTVATDGAAVLVDRDCTAARVGEGYDLMHVTVESVSSRYRFTARYTGDAVQHDILVTFDLGASSYLVTAELFEDGSGVPRVTGSDSSEDVFLDSPQTITPGLVDLTVRGDQISGISGAPFAVSVSLKVDGSDIETCS